MPAASKEPAFDLEFFTAGFQKRFGKEAMIDLRKQAARGTPGTVVSTGSIALDMALGVGGLPLGRIIDIHGGESSGKSTLAAHALKELQTMFPNKPVGYADAEQAMNREYMEKIGVDLSPKRFVFIQEQQTDLVLDMVHDMAKAGFSGVVVDSIASLISKDELEAQETTHPKYGGNSVAMSAHLRYMVKACKATNCIAIYLNQLRTNIGMMFGNPETTPGGRSLKFYASVRIRTALKEKIKRGETIVGNKISAETVKNKVAAPYRKAEYDLIYGEGVDNIGSVLDLAVENGLVAKSGAFYAYGEQKLGQGRQNTIDALHNDAKLVKTLTDTIWSLQ